MVLTAPVPRTSRNGWGVNEGFAVQGHAKTHESDQKPRYFGTDPVISKGFELVWDDGNDQGIDEEIGKNSCCDALVSSELTSVTMHKRTKHYDYSVKVRIRYPTLG